MKTIPELEIRLAQADEQDAVTACVIDAYSKWIDVIGRKPRPMMSDYGTLIAQGVVYVVPGEAGLRGLIVILPTPDGMLIENVAVCPTYQRQGIGHALLAFAEEQAHAAGLTEMRLYTNALMTVNIALYESVGYREIQRQVEAKFTVVWMQKSI